MRNLLASERSILESKLKKTKDLSEWKRIFAVLEFDDGQSIEELAHTLRLSRFTIKDYLKEYNSDDKTKNDPRGGRSSKLSDSEAKRLENHLSAITYLKVKDIISYVKKEFGLDYSRTGMTAWLQDHGFTFKRPEKVPGKIDPVKQARFIEEYRKLKDSLRSEDELYFVDAVHPEYQS